MTMTMKHNKNILVVLFFCSSIFSQIRAAQSLAPADEVVEEQVSTRPFVTYLKNVTNVLYANRSESSHYSAKHVLRVEELCSRVESCFMRGAFAEYPHIKVKFYDLFKNVDLNEWPTPATVRRWKKSFGIYKKTVIATFSLTCSRAANMTDYETVGAIVALHGELTQYVFTDEFFDFSTWELLADICVSKPIEFTIEHPLYVVGGIIALAGLGYAGYCYLNDVNAQARAKFEEEEFAKLVIGSQEEAECGAWAIYRKTCGWAIKRANGNHDDYEQLACDDERYKGLKRRAQEILAAHREAVHVDRAKKDKIKKIAKGKKLATRAALSDINYLDTDEIDVVVRALQQTPADDPYHIEDPDGDENATPYMRTTNELLAPDQVEVPYYQDQERFRADGDNLLYPADAVPADRAAHCVEVMRGPRYRELRPYIERFQRQRGNRYDFIINTNKMPDVFKAKAGSDAAATGHYYHITAINNPDADGGVEFVVSDTFVPKKNTLKSYARVLGNIRNLLRPYDEEA